ncbi:MAG: MotA/TolQ/ExbB proton channel family protein [Planctomycetes bacterium]|nr:MotA/TolQ/ExbB proton channel family protein [Planctomycetota bacterium]
MYLANPWPGDDGFARFLGLAQVDLAEKLAQGGLIAWAIIGLSIALVALSVARLLAIRYSTQCPEELWLEIDEHLGQGRLAPATELAASDPSALARVLEAVFKETDRSGTSLKQRLEDAAAEQLVRLRQRISGIGLIAAIAPMMGLLGTVSGMIRAFETMSTSETAPDPAQLAGAISEALITTYLGLTVAIPALVVHSVLRNKTTNIVLRISGYGEQLIRSLHRPSAAGRRSNDRTAAGPQR